MMKQIKPIMISVLMALAFLSTGCIFAIGVDRDQVDRSPKEGTRPVKVYVDDQCKGNAPVTVWLEAGRAYEMTFKMEGAPPRTFKIRGGKRAGWLTLDAFAGFTPVMLDKTTGAWYPLNQDSVAAVLVEEK